MPISGVIIRASDRARAEALRRELSDHSGLTLGEVESTALPAAVEAEDYPAHDALLEDLCRTAGVCAVDVVFHDFSDVTEFPGQPARRRKSR